ncbi:hypothetical protein LTR37_017342 [Vermiconidia calcicola]|uniref:Uncharacterized protein n=1 Tax=Vermiconidia calcicola TaxID=1690605 RepID=A0ACC3MKC5_9PEZI|nr:hypothetical protein LTR37_017342 [Vermiconidia calcicola]
MPNLLTLPAELRDRVYELVLEEDRVIQVSNVHPVRHEADFLEPAITRVNHQLRREALPVYYGCSYFKVVIVDRMMAYPLPTCVHRIKQLSKDFVRSIIRRGFGEDDETYWGSEDPRTRYYGVYPWSEWD